MSPNYVINEIQGNMKLIINGNARRDLREVNASYICLSLFPQHYLLSAKTYNDRES